MVEEREYRMKEEVNDRDRHMKEIVAVLKFWE